MFDKKFPINMTKDEADSLNNAIYTQLDMFIKFADKNDKEVKKEKRHLKRILEKLKRRLYA